MRPEIDRNSWTDLVKFSREQFKYFILQTFSSIISHLFYLRPLPAYFYQFKLLSVKDFALSSLSFTFTGIDDNSFMSPLTSLVRKSTITAFQWVVDMFIDWIATVKSECVLSLFMSPLDWIIELFQKKRCNDQLQLPLAHFNA